MHPTPTPEIAKAQQGWASHGEAPLLEIRSALLLGLGALALLFSLAT
jgi:hypothetical protein